MKRVYVARHPLEAHLVKGLLDAEGIEAFVRGEDLFGARGEVPVTSETCPSVWIVDDDLFEKAEEFVLAYSRGQVPARAKSRSWRCPRCDELLEPQFTECWQCGATRPMGR